jgi:RNA polymerase sigma-70 factor (ECF subfamily)
MVTTSPSLLARLAGGSDPRAWERFVVLYTPLLMRWSGRLGLCEADAADFTQDVLVLLVQHVRHFRYDPAGSFRAWLKTVLLNVWRKHQRKAARRPLANGQVEHLADTDPGIYVDEAEHREYLVRRALQVAKADFEPVTWQVCTEYMMKGRPPEEVAAELGISVNAVYLAKSRVLRHLRTELAGLLN